jgi:7-carboxy-7-deazaguanine synthase
MRISEIFMSIQGESTYVGLPCIFVRLAGCNLSCKWCDTSYARKPDEGRELSVDEIIGEVRKYDCWLVEVTGGEPLTQPETKDLVKRLSDLNYKVLVETNGSVSLEGLDSRLVKIVDIKCPSSGQEGTFLMENLACITPEDEVKLVIGDRNDYEFAKRFLEESLDDRTARVLFAPVRPTLDPAVLADWILKDCLKVRLQVQLHTYIWAEGKRLA